MKKTTYFPTFLLLLMTILLPAAHSASFNYDEYIKKFGELEKINEANFNNLRFTLSDKQIKKSATYKIVIRDQLSRDWLFKAGAHSSKDGAVALYRLFLFLGMDTPEIHFKTLSINGEIVEGSLQRVANVKDLKKPVSALNKKTQMYIARNHALSWLTLNHHYHPRQMIYLAEPENGLEILRVDNSINWYLFGNDQLNSSFISPMLNHVADAGYFNFWNDFVAYDVNKTGIEKNIAPKYDKPEMYLKVLQKKKFNLDLEALYSWVLFIKGTPDAFYGSFFNDIVKNDFLYSANNSATSPWFMTAEYALNFDKKNFIKNLIQRKNTSPEEFKKYYSNLASLVNDDVKFDGSKTQEIQTELSENLDNKLKTSLEIQQKIAAAPINAQDNIITDISLSTHIVFSKILVLPLTGDIRERILLLDEIINELSKLPVLKNKNKESIALSYAIKNLTKVRKLILEQKNPSQLFQMVLDYHLMFEKDGLNKRPMK